jgi:anaerobic ribonucleoside-triphosphate reductase
MLKKTQNHSLLSDDERQPCEVWTRVMGYHRPVSSFNIGKKGEYYERKFFLEAKARKKLG